MRAFVLLACFFASAFALNQGLELAQFEPANCACKCNCKFIKPQPCLTDYFVVLDAASCVRNAWDEMKLRVDLIARNINNDHKIGKHSRFSIMRYANDFSLDIELQQNLDYSHFSKALNPLETKNEGSFLNKGLEGLERYLQASRVADRKQVVIIITNGNSHPEANVDANQIRRISDSVHNNFFINTINEINENEFEVVDIECDACTWNKRLFMGQEHEGGARLTKRQIISKDDIENAMAKEVASLCYVEHPDEICTDCECKCKAPTGPAGPLGPVGPVGPVGPAGEHGVDGIPGRDGARGIDGPAGGDGCNGAHGNPGHHGKPGWEGDAGSMGGVGIMGMSGPVGAPGRGQGEQGPEGVDGPAGAAGAPGRDGADGQPGPNGMNGMRGPMGLTGASGPAGDKGRCGDAGRPGMNGKQGFNGVNGANGEQGPVGNAGRQGFPGKQGPAGATGAQGAAGRNGQDGAPGAPGSKGMPGPTGERGGMNARTSDLEGFVRQKVSAILDRMLDGSARGSGRRNEFFCSCKAFNLYDVVVAGMNM